MEELTDGYPGLYKVHLRVPHILENAYTLLTQNVETDVKTPIKYHHNIYDIKEKEIISSGDGDYVLVWSDDCGYYPVVLKEEDEITTVFASLSFLEPYGCMIKNNLEANAHQARVVKLFLNGLRSLALKWDTGVGKTLASIFTSECMMEKGLIVGTVIICPKSLITNFQDDIKRYGGDMANYSIFSYEGFVNKFNLIKDPLKIELLKVYMKDKLLIADEAHRLRTKISLNKETEEVRAGKKAYVAIKAAKYARNVILLTATPIFNKLRDVCNLVDMMDQTGDFSRSVDISQETFVKLVAGRFSVKEKGQNNPDFPRVNMEYLTVELSDEQRANYRELLGGADVRVDYEPNTFYTGRRIGNNFIDISSKAEKILKILKDKSKHRRKSLIFSDYKDAGIELVKSILEDKGFKCKIISGDIDSHDRDVHKKLYDKGKIDCLLLTRAGGEGLDFKNTKNMFIMESGWNPGSLRQKIGRGVRYKSHLPGDWVDVYVLKAETDPEGGMMTGDDILEGITYAKEEDVQDASELIKKTSVETELGLKRANYIE